MSAYAPYFDDVQQRHRDHPETFAVPSDGVLDALQPGDFVKVICEGELFWVKLTEISRGLYTGTVDNELIGDHVFGYGDDVVFYRHHVAAVEPAVGTP